MKPLEEILENSKIWNYTPFPMNSAFVKLPDCGTCSVIWGNNEDGYEHVSVSPKKKFNMPTWNDMCALKDMFFKDDEEVYQIHPKKSEYVNVVENCLHLWKPIGHELNELVETKTEEKPRWIPVTERLPEEHDSIFAKFKGPEEWKKGIFAKVSDDVLVTIKCEDGEQEICTTAKTRDGEWKNDFLRAFRNAKVIAWMPFPEPYKE